MAIGQERRFVCARIWRNRRSKSLQIFIDEGGSFTPVSGFSVVCSLTVPDKSVGLVRRQLVRLTDRWPKANGELKGGILNLTHLKIMVDLLFWHDAILHCSAVDAAR